MSTPPAQLAPEAFAQHLYGMLAPLARQDSANGWSLLTYVNAIGEMFELVEDWVRDTPDGPGWSLLMDLDRCPDEALPWLGQLAGVRVLPGSSPDEMRQRIASTDGFRRGTRAALIGAAQATLTGRQTVIFRERDHNPADTPDYAYYLTVRTYAEETPVPIVGTPVQPLTLAGSEITDAVRAAAPGWPTTQQGGSVDGPPFDFYLAASGNEITDQQRAAAAAWLTTQLGGSVDGLPLDYYLSLTGNEITDGQRAAALTWPITQQGGSTDGLTAPGGLYVGDSRTNLFRRGQCDALTDWTQAGGGTTTVTLDATTPAPFSPQSVKQVCNGGAGNFQGILTSSAAGQAATPGTLVVGSMWFKGVAGQSYSARVRWTNTDTTTTFGTQFTFNATGAWQLVVAPSLAVGAGLTGDIAKMEIFQAVANRVETLWFAHPQIEKLLGTGSLNVGPYIATSGGNTQARGASVATLPLLGMNSTRGWMAIRCRMGWPGANPQSTTFMSLDDLTLNNRISFVRSGGTWQSRRVAAGVAGNGASIAEAAWVTGDTRVLIIRWDATTVAISANGAPFVSAANPGSAFAPLALQVGGGSSLGGLAISSSINWFACGTGTLTDADAATLNGLTTLPTASALPGAATLAINDFVNPYASGPVNLVPNGGFENNTTGWGVLTGNETLARITTDHQYGTACLSVTAIAAGTAGSVADNLVNGNPVPQGPYTVSAWVKGVGGGIGRTLILQVNESGGVSVDEATAQVSVVLTGAWQRVTASATMKKLDRNRIYAFADFTATAAGQAFLIDGVQLEPGLVATPYIDTNGARAANPQGLGVWEAGTNMFRRGQCDNITDWGNVNAGSVNSIDATSKPPFGPQSVKFVCDGTVANQGLVANGAPGQAAAAGVVGVGSIWFKGVKGQSYFHQLRWHNTDASETIGAQTTFIASGQWQLLTPPSIAVGAGKTGDYLTVHCRINGQRVETFWVAHTMLQKGVNVVTPYVATSGGNTAARAAARVQVPASHLSATQGWFATRVRMGQTSALVNPIRFLGWGDDSNHRLTVYALTGNLIGILRTGGAGNQCNVTKTWNAGDVLNIVAAWTATQVKISVNGAPFVTLNDASIPAINAATFDVGDYFDGTGQLDSSMLWFASGIGTLTDGDAATLAGLATLPDKSLLPGAATLAMNDVTLPWKSLTVPEGFGIWGAATNLFRRGQCDAVTDWISAVGGEAFAVDATVKPPFSSQSIKVTTQGLDGQGCYAGSAAGQAAAAGVNGVASVWFKGTKGFAYKVWIRWVNTDASNTSVSQTGFLASGSWQRLVPLAVPVAAGKTGDSLRVYVMAVGQRAPESFWVAHAQLEKANVVSPYIATSGGATAARAAGRVQVPAAMTDERQGWWVARVRMGFDGGQDPWAGGDERIAAFWDTAPEFLDLRYNAPTRSFKMTRQTGGVGVSAQSVAQNFLFGDVFTVIGMWDIHSVYVSVNGGPFVSAANSSVPVLAASTFSIGAGLVVPGRELDGRVLWFAAGTGELANADAAAFHAFGNAGPSDPTVLPGHPTMLWHAVDGNAVDVAYAGLTDLPTYKALMAQKPGGIVLNYAISNGQDWQQVKNDYATWADVKAAYHDWVAVVTDEPG